MTKLKLYSAWYCPFAQRAWMALEHEKIEYDYVEIDPYEKTQEWMKISRGTGQVPVIVDEKNDISVPDSVRVLEYIDAQFFNSISLYAQSRVKVADAKYWIDYQGRAIIPYLYRLLQAEQDSDVAGEIEAQLEQGLEGFAAHMDENGPYFFGRAPGAVDIAFAPFALRIEILLSHYKNYVLPKDSERWRRYHKWWDAMRSFEPLIKTSIGLPDYTDRLIEFYLPYTTGGGQADVTDIK